MIAFFTNFWSLLLDSTPFLLLGSLCGTLLQHWLNPVRTERWLRAGPRSLLVAVLAGALLPGCAMSTMPVAQSLKTKGAPVGTLTAFIMIAPILSPHTIVLNAAVLGWRMTLGRIILPMSMSLALGWILNRLNPAPLPVSRGIPLTNAPTGDCGCDGGKCTGEIRTTAGRARKFLAEIWAGLRPLLPYFFGGLAAVALLQVFITPDDLARHMRTGWLAYGSAAALGIPLYVCDGGEIPLTRALLQAGVGVGPAFTFLLSSVGTCLPTIGMASKVIGWKALLAYLICWLVLAVGGGLLLEVLS